MLLGARRSVQEAAINIEMSIRGMLRNFGLRLGRIGKVSFEDRVRELTEGNKLIQLSIEPMLRARAALRSELVRLERMARDITREDPVCRLMMSCTAVLPRTSWPMPWSAAWRLSQRCRCRRMSTSPMW